MVALPLRIDALKVDFCDFWFIPEQLRLWRALRDQGSVQGFVVQMTPPGSSERLWISLTIRRRANNEKAAWIGSGQNVTDEHNNEQALIHLQKEKTQEST